MKRGIAPRNDVGVTFLEILVAMLILGSVTGGLLTAFVSARQYNYQSELQLSVTNSIQGSMEETRLAVGGASPGGINLTPGIYVDRFMASPPVGVNNPPTAPTPLLALDMPPEWRARYQTNAGRTPAATWADHGDGRVMVVEGLVDLDGDGLTGVGFTGPGKVDLYRVKVRLRWSPPTA